MTHRFPIRVYYEDTDLAGIVYYANYLKFIERGRSEWVRELGVDQAAMKRDEGVVFAVRRVEADYHSPAQYDDELVVTTEVDAVTGARLIVRQNVERDGKVLFTALVTIVAINDAGAPARLPAAFRRNLH
ncbi:tol-pal system-associated acyl-CoA thioesterase [Octadecabacter sp. 1_MG-2023]|uniref:tol-pal system-associated acyl-CoA thioesterase n=1 Tax=unclassified Octadecabacter TaxID=196158 RepID=UPI001C0A5089|nr:MULTISPECIES: tol-pal system-associated acyl-CoA thioesterase [unclassified Octadecabacter]MBU2991974.1 tol-pal system-associated acyl-CoA thioesterase [Octadecabacter sp. B2R22]MDO6735948.1 tol-pal system-associated acyl-CoA thioesterase [Octadecabacter sp. 1_MG-2023]